MKKIRHWIPWVGLALLASVAAGSFLYLKKTEAVLKAALEPLDLSAPELFPRETLLFVGLHGVNEGYARMEEWWRRFEPTAMSQALGAFLEAKKKAGPSELRSLLELFESQMDSVEKRFGYRPTTTDFFEVYGKYAALGLLPPQKGSRPGFLAVVQLPGGPATAMLQSQLKQSDLRSLGEVHGFPVFIDERKGPGSYYYGVGSGFLFIADDVADLEESLGRLARARDQGQAPKASFATPGALSSDAIFTRGVPGPWKEIRLALYLKRKLSLGSWREELKVLDEYVQSAFAIAPTDEAVAFSAVEAEKDGNLALRSSLPHQSNPSWAEVLPAGVAYLDQSVAIEPQALRKAYGPALSDLRDKQLWKEIGELLESPQRLGTLFREALPPGVRPGEAVLKRLPHDARFLARALVGALEAEWLTPPPSTVQAVKAYPSTRGISVLQHAFAFEVDPLSSFLIAGALDLACSSAKGWILRGGERGLLSWRVDMEKLIGVLEKKAETEPMKDALGGLKLNPPSVILSGGRIFLVLGNELALEISALLSGASKASLSSDPLFQEASARVHSGYVALNYRRQAVLDEAIGSVLEAALTLAMARNEMPAGAKETLRALMTALRQAVAWERSVRAEITATYPDLEEPATTVTLMDSEAEQRCPGIALPPAPPRAPGLLPGTTYWLTLARVEPRAAYDALLDSFCGAFPGGKAAIEKYRRELGPVGQMLEDFERDLVRNSSGEVGFAVTLPELAADARQVRSPADFFQRAPGILIFLECRDAKAALQAFANLFSALQDASRSAPTPGFAWRGIKALSGQMNGHSALALEAPLSIGGREGPKLTLCALERDGFLILASSDALLAFLANVAAGGENTLAKRLERGFPESAIPARLSRLQLFTGDGVIDQLRLFLDPLLPLAASWTLQGYGGRPPGERVAAHLAGWTRFLELVDDLFRSRAWSMTYTVREGDRLETRSVRRLELKS